MSKQILEYYSVLGVSPGASVAEIKRAYRRLIQQWHPDRYKAGSLMQTTAEDMTKDLNEAHEQLCKRQLWKKFPPKAEPKKAEAPARPPARPQPSTPTAEPERRKPAPARTPGATPPRPAPPRPPPLHRATPPFRQPAASARTATARRRNLTPALRRRPWVLAAAAIVLAIAGALVRFHPSAEPLVEARGHPRPKLRSAPTTATAQVSIPVSSPATSGDHASIAPGEFRGPTAIGTAIDPSNSVSRAWETPMISSHDWPATETRSSIAPNPPLLPASNWNNLLNDATALLDTIATGDSKFRVLAIQGAPDEIGLNLCRYGSSIIYFRDGVVTGWSDGHPRLRVHQHFNIGFDLVAAYAASSSALADTTSNRSGRIAFSTDPADVLPESAGTRFGLLWPAAPTWRSLLLSDLAPGGPTAGSAP